MKIVPMMERKSPIDPAPDWIDQTYYVRACNCLMMLELLGIITNKEHLEYHSKMDNWLNQIR